jgi:lipid-A-disaccharide synthase
MSTADDQGHPKNTLLCFIVAGEESGDRLGAGLMRALRRVTAGNVRFAGIGGQDMAAEGLVSLFAIDDLAIMGFAAIPRRLPTILRRIREAADAVIATRPDGLVIIDSPDFTHRVARRVRAAMPGIPIINYVSPSVWAWRPGRARAMRRYVDHVLALFPFEPEAHARLGGPPCTYVGHPIVEHAAALRPNAAEAYRRLADPPIVLVLPGSRRSEIRRLLAVFEATIAQVAARHGALEVVLPTVPRLLPDVTEAAAKWTITPRVVIAAADKWAAFRRARAALAASGTVTLELAVAGVPTVVAYRVPLIEELIVRPLIRVPSIVFPNLVLGENVVPEFLQRQVKADRLAEALAAVLGDTPARRRQTEAFARLDAIMDIGGSSPSAKAAKTVLDVFARGHSKI